MGGRGSRFTPGAEVLDPLLAQALVLEDSTGERLLWISMDMIGMSYHATSELRLELVAATDIVAEHKHGHGHGHGVELEGCAHCVVQ